MLDQIKTNPPADLDEQYKDKTEAAEMQEPSLTPQFDQLKRSLSPELISLVLPKRGLSVSQKDAYAETHRNLELYFRPVGLLEQFEIGRIANLIWDCGCLCRYKDSFLRNARSESLERLLEGRIENPSAIAHSFRLGDANAVGQVQEIFDRFGLDEDDIDAQSLIHHLTTMERLKRLEAAAIRELTQILRDLDQRKRIREESRLRELQETLRMRQFEKYGLEISVPKK